MPARRPCPPDKIVNPPTGRCVTPTGAIGQRLLQRAPTPPPAPPPHPLQRCPPDKILNPPTRKCVSRTGAIGKRLLRQPSPSPPPPPLRQQRCPADKIVNPATGRCVSRAGAIGRKLEQRRQNRLSVSVGAEEIEIPASVLACDAVLTYRQEGPICWFTAIMATLFMSQGMRLVVARALPRLTEAWKLPVALAMARYLQGYSRVNAPGDLLGKLEPHKFLEFLRSHKPDVFNQQVQAGVTGGQPEVYTGRFLDFLGVSHFVLWRPGVAYRERFLHSVYNNQLPFDQEARAVKARSGKLVRYPTATPDAPTVLLLNTGGSSNLETSTWKILPEEERVEGVLKTEHARRVRYRGHWYALDSVVLINDNYGVCKLAHAIAGVTCRGQRFMYNGWAANSANKAMGQASTARAKACALMPVDWAKHQSLKIDLHKCTMVPVPPEEHSSGFMRFTTTTQCSALYIRED